MITTPNQFTWNGSRYYVVSIVKQDDRYYWRYWATRYYWIAVILRKRIDLLIAWADWLGKRLNKQGRIEPGGVFPKTTVFYWFAVITDKLHDGLLTRLGMQVDIDEVRRLAIN